MNLREAAQQALEALTNCTSEYGHRCNRCDSEVDEGGKVVEALRAALVEDVMQKFTDVNQELMAALGCDHCNQPLYAAVKCRVCGRVTEPVQDTGVKLKPVFYAPRRLDDAEVEDIIKRSECPNCASLQDQNTELDRKLAEMEQTSLELCETCGWRTLIPGDCCLNCVRQQPKA